MAGDLDFSVQLRLLNDQFNNGINEASDKFTAYAESVQRNVTQMNADTERATASLAGLGNVRPDRLTAELRATADQLRNMGAGANLSGEQVQNAMRTAAGQVTRLGTELNEAKLEAARLAQTGASPRDLEAAAQKVNRLETNPKCDCANTLRFPKLYSPRSFGSRIYSKRMFLFLSIFLSILKSRF